MQQRSAAARKTDDKERLADFLVCDLRVKLPVLLHSQTRAQDLHNIRSKGDFSDPAESCLAVAGLKQTRERFKKVAAPEIIESAISLCGLDQISRKRPPG